MIGINESPGTSSKFPGLSSASPKRVTLRVHEHFSLRSNTWLERVSPPIIESIFKHYLYEFSRMLMLPHSPTSRVEPATTVPLYNGFLSQPVVGCYHRHRRYSLSMNYLLIRFSALPILCILTTNEKLHSTTRLDISSTSPPRERPTATPDASNALILSPAPPAPLDTIAPACPIRLAGGADTPAP